MQVAKSVVSMLGVVLVVLLQIASATNFYVSVNGSDSNPGTLSQPFQTIGKGIAESSAGTTVWVLPGNYTVSTVLGFNQKSGNESSPITISGLPDQPRPIVDARNLPKTGFQNHGIYVYYSNHIVIRRMAFVNAPGYGALVFGGSNVEVLECEIANSFSTGMAAQDGASSVYFHDNWVHDTVNQNMYQNFSASREPQSLHFHAFPNIN